jgi:aryl-alcohol dehydrogenase-like predicted oxidoreductase
VVRPQVKTPIFVEIQLLAIGHADIGQWSGRLESAAMRYRQMGMSGLTVSVVGLGGNNFGARCDQQQTSAIVHAALDVGINFIDTAEMYGGGNSETMLGVAVKGRRDDVVIATKFGIPNGPIDNARGSRRYVRRAVEASLRRLQSDYVDLLYVHFADPLTPIAETLDAMNELVTAGKVRYLGVCRVPAWRLVDADWTALSRGRERFIACQDRYNLLERQVENEVIPACQRLGVGFVPFYPLAAGLLTGKYRPGEPPPPGARLPNPAYRLDPVLLERVVSLEQFAAERGLSVLQVALGGLAAQPAVTSVIAGATSVEQVQSNVAAAAWEPQPDELSALDTLYRGWSARP